MGNNFAMYPSSHIPEDATIVLAMRVRTRSAYAIYRKLSEDCVLSYERMKNKVIFVPVDSEGCWGWCGMGLFDNSYEAVDTEIPGYFTLFRAKSQDLQAL